MAVLGVDDFKAKLKGGGARPNLFQATLNFPSFAGGDVELTSFMCEGRTITRIHYRYDPGTLSEVEY